jgi:hypothetical protein
MLQKIPQRLAWLVAKYGMGVLPTFQGGRYGRGLYFSSSLEYVKDCVNSGEEEEGFAYMLSLVVPGNAFPVTENPLIDGPSFIGRPCRPGYQSHYAMVQASGDSFGLPVSPGTEGLKMAGELVIFDPSQAIPLFIFKLDELKNQKASVSKIGKVRKEWNIDLDSTWDCKCQSSPSSPLDFCSSKIQKKKEKEKRV